LDFSASSGKPFVIRPGLGRAASQRPARHLPGVRLEQCARQDFDGRVAHHGGVGLSIDQRISENLTVFGRYGHQTSGRVRFADALTVGGELDGSPWGRGADGLGLALAWLRTSGRFAAASAAAAGYVAHGAERIGELYYRMHLNPHVELTPSVQYIARPAADPGAKGIALLGLRARVGF
jgi:Carbohydrate-selective porin